VPARPRPRPRLPPSQLLGLYLGGALAGAIGHLGYYFLDAGGWQYGLKYAANTPAFFGGSGGVAAVLAYKAALEPAAMKLLVVVPLPIVFVAFVYCCLEMKEAVRLQGRGEELFGGGGMAWRWGGRGAGHVWRGG
jgi:membrane associated rhomboid family serine protease